MVVGVLASAIVADFEDAHSLGVVAIAAEDRGLLSHLTELVAGVVEELGGDAGFGLRQRVAVCVVRICHVGSANNVIDRFQAVDGVVGVGQVFCDGRGLEGNGPLGEPVADSVVGVADLVRRRRSRLVGDGLQPIR